MEKENNLLSIFSLLCYTTGREGLHMNYKKPNIFIYRLTQGVAWFIATFVFRRKIVRNEIKGKKGPFVVIANHQAKLDFTTLIGATKRPMSIVVSNSFYQSMPIKKLLDYLGMIPKQ